MHDDAFGPREERDYTLTLPFLPEAYYDITDVFFKAEIFHKEWNYLRQVTYTYEAEHDHDPFVDVPGFTTLFWYADSPKRDYFYLRFNDDCSFVVNWQGKKINIFIGSNQKEIVDKVVDIFVGMFPEPIIKRTEDEVPLNFWALGRGGQARQRDKKIKPLFWKDIERNYVDPAKTKFSELLQLHPPLEGGRLMLFHGLPGTGKSSAIRNLVWDWMPWCDTSYVVDPDQFFQDSDYMLSVLLDQQGGDSYQYQDDSDDKIKNQRYTLHKGDRWHLLIVEDADEFLRTDAKARTGQAMSRLLNFADGLIGQGLNFLILITTNEQLTNIHPAIQREGRCFANIEFGKFDIHMAQEWLGSRIPSERLTTDKEYTLAQLYDIKRKMGQIKAEVAKSAEVGQYL